jgi:hypothetical protein
MKVSLQLVSKAASVYRRRIDVYRDWSIIAELNLATITQLRAKYGKGRISKIYSALNIRACKYNQAQDIFYDLYSIEEADSLLSNL